jgi:hypothetical protein
MLSMDYLWPSNTTRFRRVGRRLSDNKVIIDVRGFVQLFCDTV